MTSAIEQLKSQVGTLTVPERADLAFFLLSSLEPEEDGVETAWNSEIKRRIDEIRDGQAVGRSADEVHGASSTLPMKPAILHEAAENAALSTTQTLPARRWPVLRQ